MDNHIFRSAISGFNRQDVMEYIEKTQKETAAVVERLEAECEELRRNADMLRGALDACGQEKTALAQQLEDMTARCEETQTSWAELSTAAERLRDAVAQQDASIQELTHENQQLTQRLAEMEGEVSGIRVEKEKIAQLELEARMRCDAVLADAQQQAESAVQAANEQADALLRAAQEQAEHTARQADEAAQEVGRAAQERARCLTEETEARAAQLRQELSQQVTGAAEEYETLRTAVESITTHVSGELRKLNVAVTQLPINFDHIKDSLQSLQERAQEK